MYTKKHLLSTMLVTSFLSIPFRVASLMLICSAIESLDQSQEEIGENVISIDGSQMDYYDSPLYDDYIDDFNTDTFNAEDAKIKMVHQSHQKAALPSLNQDNPQSLSQSPQKADLPSLNQGNLRSFIQSVRLLFKDGITSAVTSGQNMLQTDYLSKKELLLKLRESLRIRECPDILIERIYIILWNSLIDLNRALSKPDISNENLSLDKKILNIKTIDIIIKNIKNLIIQLRAQEGKKGIDRYDYENEETKKNNETIISEIIKLIKVIQNSILEVSKGFNSEWTALGLDQLDSPLGNSSKVKIMNEIIDMIGLVKTKYIYEKKEDDLNEILKLTIDKIIAVTSEIISKRTKQSIKDIRLTVILIKRIINLIKEAKIENKDDTYIDTQIEIIKKILKFLTIDKNQNNNDDLILMDITIQTILDGKLNKQNGIIMNAVLLLNLLKEKNLSNQNINSVINFIFYITKIITEDDPYYNLSGNMIMSIRSMIKSLLKKAYF